MAPVAWTPTDPLSSATSVLSVLKPTVVVNQVLNVATGVISLDMPGILNNLIQLPQKVAALYARGAHDIAGQLNIFGGTNAHRPDGNTTRNASTTNFKWT